MKPFDLARAIIPKALGRARDTRIVRSFVSQRTGLPYRAAHSDIRDIHRWFQSWVYVCTDRNATAVGQQELCLFHRTGNTPRATKKPDYLTRKYLKSAANRHYTEDATEVLSHPFLDLMARPNPILDQSGLMWLTASALQLMGNAYWHVNLDSDGMPNEIWPLPSQLVFPLLGPDRVYDRYELRIGGHIQKFDAKEIVHFRKPSPIDTISAFGNLRGIIEAAETNTKMLEFERALFENMAVPDMLLVPKGETTPEQIEALNESWQEKFRGWLNRGKVATAPVELGVEKIGLNMRELQHKETKYQIREEIAAGFGIPMPILTVDGTTFNNMSNGMRLWAKFTILPLCSKITDTINTSIMPFYMPRNDLESLDGMPERQQFFVVFDNPVPEDEDAKVAHAESMLRSGSHPINDIRRDLYGDDPVPWGDEPWMPDGVSQPSTKVEQTAFDQALQTSAALAATELAGASPEAMPPTLSELTQTLTMFKDGNDVDGYNIVRSALADRFGVSIPPITSIAPSATAGVVQPDAAEDRPGAMDADEPGGAPGSPGGAGGGDGDRPGAGSSGGDPEKGKPKTGEGAKKDAGTDETHPTAEQAGRLVLAKARAADFYDHPAQFASKRLEALGVKLPVAVVDGEEKTSGLEGVLAALFTEMRQDVVARVSDPSLNFDSIKGMTAVVVSPDGSKLASATKELTSDIVSFVFRGDHWTKRFADGALPYLEMAFEKGSVLGQLDLRGKIEVAARMGAEDVKAAADRLAQTFASSVVDTTGEQVAAVIKTAIDGGLGQNEMAANIAKLHGEKTDSHSLTIARTELNNALNAGASTTWKMNGVDENEWLTSPDGCEFCDALDKKVVRIGSPFVKKGSVLTGAKGGTMKASYKSITHPTLHPRCRCTLLPVV